MSMELKFRECVSVISLIGMFWRIKFPGSLTSMKRNIIGLLNINERLLFSFMMEEPRRICQNQRQKVCVLMTHLLIGLSFIL